MLDLVHHLVRDSDPHSGLFDGLLRGLRALESPSDLELSLARFQWLALQECGFLPELNRDVATGSALVPAASYGFSAARGGFLSDPGRDTPGQTMPGDRGRLEVWRVRGETVEILRGLSTRPEVDPTNPRWSGEPRGPLLLPAAIARVNRFLATYFQTILGRWPPSAYTVFPGIADPDSRAGA